MVELKRSCVLTWAPVVASACWTVAAEFAIVPAFCQVPVSVSPLLLGTAPVIVSNLQNSFESSMSALPRVLVLYCLIFA